MQINNYFTGLLHILCFLLRLLGLNSFFWGEGHLPLYPLHFVDLYVLLYLLTTKSLTQTFSTRCISLQPKTEFSLSHISCFKIMKLFTLCEGSGWCICGTLYDILRRHITPKSYYVLQCISKLLLYKIFRSTHVFILYYVLSSI